jgi:4-amino-4-deoxy-L-arabinose transferase-like glycosyltransferase
VTRATRIEKLLLIAILLFAATVRLVTLNEPFQRNAEGCASFYGLLARNYFRYHWSDHHGVPVMSMGKGAEPTFYAKHPPTTPLLIAAVFAVTGYRGQWEWFPGEWQVRLPTALLTIACIITIYLMVRNRATPRAGLIAAALLAAIPMTLVFGGFPDVISPQLVLMALLTVAAYERFHDDPTWPRFGWMCLAFTGAALTDWPAFYLVLVLGLHFVLTRPWRAWGWMIGFGMLSIAVFAALYAHLAMAQGDWRWMLAAVEHRTISTAGDESEAFTLGQWLLQAVWTYGIGRHTLLVCIIGMLWVPLALSRRFSGGADRLAGLLLAWALLHILVGRQGVYQHEWWWWPLTPGIVVAAALTIDALCMRLETGGLRRATGVLLTLAVIGFAGWNVRAVLLERASYPQLAYSLVEFGQVIRDHTSPDAAAALADSDMSLAFWYYADRAVKRHIWSREALHRRTTSELHVDGPFDRWQPWDGPITTVIIPRVYLHEVPTYIQYLHSSFPGQQTERFVVYYLTTQSTGARRNPNVQ